MPKTFSVAIPVPRRKRNDPQIELRFRFPVGSSGLTLAQLEARFVKQYLQDSTVHLDDPEARRRLMIEKAKKFGGARLADRRG